MNWSHFVNPEFDELIDQAMATIDEDERFALLYYISTRANEEVIWIPTLMDITARAHNVNLIQPELSSSGNNYLNMVYWAE
jgi:ABC-type transport system substrate-binding protein